MALPGEPGADPYNARMDEQGLQTAELLKIETMADSPMVSPSESPYTTDSASSRIHPFRSPTTPFWQRPPLEEETDPTSIAPSELSDDLDRKQTESPADSNNAVHGANYSIHSRSSGSYSDRSEARERAVPAAVNADRVKAIGVQFAEESSAEGVSVARFHDPENDVEARYIRDKIRQANGKRTAYLAFVPVRD